MLHKGRDGKKRLTEKMHMVSGLLGSAHKVNLDGRSEAKEAVKLDDEDEVTMEKNGR